MKVLTKDLVMRSSNPIATDVIKFQVCFSRHDTCLSSTDGWVEKLLHLDMLLNVHYSQEELKQYKLVS